MTPLSMMRTKKFKDSTPKAKLMRLWFHFPMNQAYIHVVSLCFLFSLHAEARRTFHHHDTQDAVSSFTPCLGVGVGIISIMFSITFLLLLYVKCFRRGSNPRPNPENRPGLTGSRQSSGIDKKVIESLPFFRFSSLKSSKEGLECAVCLSKFEDIEILRLLPKCKHTFHINCIDHWLERHSSCPLCRHRVSADDLTIFEYSNSMRIMNQAEIREESNLELFIGRGEEHHGSTRFSIGSSFRKMFKSNREGEVSIPQGNPTNPGSSQDQKLLHKFNHKIVVSNVVFKNRWSNVSSSDLMFLNSEILDTLSSSRFSELELTKKSAPGETREPKNDWIMKIEEEMERKRLFESRLNPINKGNSIVSNPAALGFPSTSRIIEPNPSSGSNIMAQTGKRSMSEITGVTRFGYLNLKGNDKDSSENNGDSKEERMRRLWFPIARRTVQCFANREKRSLQLQSQDTIQTPDV